MAFDVAFIGTGPEPGNPGPDGYAMAYRHAAGYRRLDDCALVACADIVPEHAQAFADAFELEHVYEDHLSMVHDVEPDIISVCVPPASHADIVTSCARTRLVEAIHCEKPMAKTWGGCRDMVKVCEENGVQLTVNHQRRFGAPFRRAKSLLDQGVIGELGRIEVAEVNLFDAGSHLFDLCGYFTDQASPEWALAQVEYSEENLWFGAHNENQAVAQWQYDDGTYGLAASGPARPFVGCYLRLRGDAGEIDIGVYDGPTLRLTNAEFPGGRVVDTGGEDIHGPAGTGFARAAINRVSGLVSAVPKPREPSSFIDRAIEDVVAAVRTGERSELRAANALQSTELIFACWESVRRPGRIDLPLEIDDNPLESMVEDGALPVSTNQSS